MQPDSPVGSGREDVRSVERDREVRSHPEMGPSPARGIGRGVALVPATLVLVALKMQLEVGLCCHGWSLVSVEYKRDGDDECQCAGNDND